MQTNNPDAWKKNEEFKAALRKTLEIERAKKIEHARIIVERELEALTPENWYEGTLHHGRLHMSGDEVFVSAIECDPDTHTAWAKLATSEAAKELRAAIAKFHAEMCHDDILQARDVVKGLV